MIQCQGCTCAGWLWEGEGGLGDHQPGVYVPLKALFLVSYFFQIMSEYDQTFDPNILTGHCDLISRFSDFCLISRYSNGL